MSTRTTCFVLSQAASHLSEYYRASAAYAVTFMLMEAGRGRGHSGRGFIFQWSALRLYQFYHIWYLSLHIIQFPLGWGGAFIIVQEEENFRGRRRAGSSIVISRRI